MFRFIKVAPGILAAALAASLALPAVAIAQQVPSYADSTSSGNADETISGRVNTIDGTFDLSVNDDRGFVDHVHLHQGTIINPTGLTLAPEMAVTILGYNAGSVFEANEIDTPYSYDGPAPVPVYYGPGWWYPGYAYGYGPSFSLALVFGSGGWSYAHQPWGGRWYDNHPWNGGNRGGAFNAASGGTRSYGTETRRAAPAGGSNYQASTFNRSTQPYTQRSTVTSPSYGRTPQASFHGGPLATRTATRPETRGDNNRR